ncbi:MAG: YncE family protein [Polyangiaceae bacterium]
MPAFGAVAIGCATLAAAAQGCDDSATTSSTGSTSGADGGAGGAGATTSSTTTTGSMNSSTSSGMMNPGCTTAITGPTRGSAIAITSDDSRLVVVNRDAGSVSIMDVDPNTKAVSLVEEIPVGGEPWQVAINGCDDTAYVVLRKDQKVVEITGIDANPAVGKSVAVGSEPASIAITPHNSALYVSNWVDGTLSVIDPITMTVTDTVDLNATIVGVKDLANKPVLGNVTPRAALAHPRGLAIDGGQGADDSDIVVYATEWFAVRTAPESATGTASDKNWKGLLYKVDAKGAATAIDLPSVDNTGFKDTKGQDTGCFPNQIANVTIDGGFAYVTSTCASPVGPTGVVQKGACTTTMGQCGAFGAGSVCVGAGTAGGGVCTNSCAQDSDCGALAVAGDCVLPAGTCKPQVENARTTTHPALSIVDLGTDTATTVTLDKLFDDEGKKAPPAFPMDKTKFPRRMPLLPTDIGFRPGFAYITAEGADAAFRLTIANGAITAVGSDKNNFIDTRSAMDKTIRLPIGIAMAHASTFAFVANDGNQDVTVLDLGIQAVQGEPVHTSPLPTDAEKLSALKGKRFFNTGLGRWSLRGEAWGSCAACHIDGLTDNVTWYFARGPRQTVSLDGSFAPDGVDQRIFNWSGIFDEVADFEGNTRGISGGVGALVSVAGGNACAVATQAVDCPSSKKCNPSAADPMVGTCAIAASDRINTNTTSPPQAGLQGSSFCTAQSATDCPSTTPHSVLTDWVEVTDWVRTIRSPRKPTNLVAADVTEGAKIFAASGQGNCVGCHGGAKWTISTLFYAPDNTFNDAPPGLGNASSLTNTKWEQVPSILNMFPSSLLPASANQVDRFGGAPAFEQLLCAIRPVGTIGPLMGAVPTGVSAPEINVLELRQDMVTGGQGSGLLPNEPGKGFNVPSLLGVQVGAPYFHAGNARTLEEGFSNLFLGHHKTEVASVNVLTPDQVRQLTAFVLSIDETTPVQANQPKGAKGGDICVAPQ